MATNKPVKPAAKPVVKPGPVSSKGIVAKQGGMPVSKPAGKMKTVMRRMRGK